MTSLGFAWPYRIASCRQISASPGGTETLFLNFWRRTELQDSAGRHAKATDLKLWALIFNRISVLINHFFMHPEPIRWHLYMLIYESSQISQVAFWSHLRKIKPNARRPDLVLLFTLSTHCVVKICFVYPRSGTGGDKPLKHCLMYNCSFKYELLPQEPSLTHHLSFFCVTTYNWRLFKQPWRCVVDKLSSLTHSQAVSFGDSDPAGCRFKHGWRLVFQRRFPGHIRFGTAKPLCN